MSAMLSDMMWKSPLSACRWQAKVDQCLERVCRVFGLHALLVADARGNVVGAAHHDSLTDSLAAHAPLLSLRGAPRRSIVASLREDAPQTTGRRVKVQPFSLQRETFYLCALTDPNPHEDTALRSALTQLSALMT